MGGGSSDPIAAVEAAYAPVGDEGTWLAQVLDVVGAQLFTSHGGAGAVFDARAADPREILRSVMLRGFDVRLLASMRSAFDGGTDADRSRSLHAASPIVRLSELGGKRLADHPTYAELSRELGIHDVVTVRCANPDGTGLFLATGVGLRQAAARRGAAWEVRWSRIAAHLAAGLRLVLSGRRATERDADAVLSPDGRVLEARGDAERGRAALRRAVVRVDRARGPLRRRDADAALGAWTALVDGRWSLVDAFESDGKRFVLAMQNAPTAPDPRALTREERTVAAYVAMGHANKLIAYELGVPEGTVATRVRLVARKLGASSRVALIERYALLRRAALAATHGEVGVFVDRAPAAADADRLTAAERDVAKLAARGRSNAEIAHARGCSERTVASLLARAYRKLGVASRAELATRLAP